MPRFKLIAIRLCACLIALGADHCLGDRGCSGPAACGDEVYFSRSAGPDARTALKAAFLVHGDADAVYRTLRDAEQFPEFMPGTNEVRVLEQHAGFQIVSFKGARGPLAAEVVLRRVPDDRRRRISWSLVRGSLKSSDGFWAVETDGLCGASLVTYSNTVDSKLPVPARLIHTFLRGSIEDTAVRLRQRVASGGVWQSEEFRKRQSRRQ